MKLNQLSCRAMKKISQNFIPLIEITRFLRSLNSPIAGFGLEYSLCNGISVARISLFALPVVTRETFTSIVTTLLNFPA